MTTNWAERLDNARNNLKNSTSSRWAEVLDQSRGQYQIQSLQQRLSNFYNNSKALEKTSDNFTSGWQNANSSNIFYDSAGHYYAEAEAIKKDLEENAKTYKKFLGDKEYKNIYDALDGTAKSKNAALERFKRKIDLYSQYENADDYNKAYRNNQLSTKYDRLKTFGDWQEYYNSGDFEHADLPKDEKEYLQRLGYTLEYQETLSLLSSMKQRLEGLPKEFTANKTYNPQEKAEIQAERKQLEQNIKKVEARIKEMDNMGGIYTGLNTQVTSESGEYAFDQRWSAAKKEMEDALTLTPEDKRKKMSGQKVEGKEIAIDDIFKNVKSDDYSYNYLHYATEDEQKLYSFIKKTDGEKAAQTYLEELKVAKLDKRLNQALFQKMSDYSAQNGGTAILGSLASIPASVFSGLEFAAYRLGGEKFDGIRSTLATQSQGFREGTKTHWDGAWGEKVWDFLYDTGMSGVDSAAAAGLSAAVPFLGEALLGSSAAASTYNDALDRGISHGDAMLTALTAGVAESLFEHMSISKFLDAGDITKGFTKSGLRQATKNLLTEMGVNFSEELFTEVSNIITDTAINGNLSNYAVAVKDYYMQGMSPEEAKNKALADFGKQILEAGASGALMGFGFGSISSVKGMAHSQVLNSRNGGLVKLSGNLAELKTVAELSNNEEIKAAAEKLTETSKPSEIGYVYNSLVADAVEQSVREMTPVLLENGAKESGSNSAKGWATQIANSLFDKNEGKKAELSINKVTSKVYSDFTTEGKYGGDKLLNLKNIISTPYLNQKATASEVGTVLNENGIEAPITADGSGAAIGPVAEAYKQGVAENLEKQRPNPKAMSEEELMKTYFADEVQISPEEEKVLKDFGKANGLEVEFVDGAVNGKGYGVFQNGKQIVISRYAKKPMAALFKHEFTHSVEKAKGYVKFQEYVLEESEAFKGWLNVKGFADFKDAVKYEMSKYEANKIDYNKKDNNYKKAKADVVANFVGDVLFGEVIDAKGNPIKLDTNFLVELKQNDRNLFQRFVEWVHSILKRLTTKGVVNKDIVKLEQKFKRLVEQARQQRAKGEGEKSEGEQSQGEYALPDVDKTKYADYDKPITAKDIEVLRSIGRKSVNEFKPADLEKAQKWAYKFWSQLHEKSPFFRAWFGDWRAYDIKNKIPVINKSTAKTFKAGKAENVDTGRYISWGDQIKGETKIKYGTESEVYGFLENIEEIVKNSILLDTNVSVLSSKHKMDNTEFMHSMYSIIEDKDGNECLIKLLVEEAFNDKMTSDFSRAYELQEIKKVATLHTGVHSNNGGLTRQVTTNYSISELFNFVKQYDKSFNPNPVNQYMVNEDGTPKKFYHGTREKFTEFSKKKAKPGFYGRGFYFTTEKSQSNVYGESMEVFLKIENPLMPGETKITKNQIIKFLEAVAENEDYSIENYGTYDVNEVASRITNRDAFDVIQDVNSTAIGDFGEAMQLFNEVNGTSFDGVITPTETVVYDNTQIKSAISNIGTFDSTEGDIRYSLPDIPDIAKGKSNTELRTLVDEGKITEDEALAEISRQFGTMPKGENPKVDVDVPNKVSDTKGVRRFARTALESGHLTEGMSEDAKREIINGALNYEISSNKMVTNIAEKKVAKDINGAIQEWEGLIASGRIPTAGEIALGEVLLVEAAKAGNANDVAMYLAEIAALGTQLGQGIQALSLLKKLTGVGQLHYVSRVIAQMNEDLKRRYGDKFQDVLSVDPNLEEILAKSKNQAEIEEVIDDILTDVAKQMPSTWLDKFNAWRYLAMLGNTRTHIRNFLGNAIFLPAIRIKDALGTIGERMFIKDASHRTKVFKVNKKYREYAMKDFEEVKGLLTRGGKMNPSDIVQDRRKIFTSKLFAPVEKFRKFNFDMLEAEDLIFLKRHYIHALGSVLQSRGLDVNNITEKQLTDARNYAVNEAKKATYRDFSFFANMLNKLAHPTKNGKPVKDVMTKGVAVLVEGALPFKKTPINILKRGIEYSPLGIATTIGNAFIAGRRGEFSGAEFIDGITASMTGTMILGLGMLLQSMGWLVGGLGYDDEDALERLSGAQPYAIDFGDWSYTIDWMAPSSLPLLIGAEISKAFAQDEDGHISDLLLAIAEPMTELSFLQGVNDIIEGVAYSGENGLGVTGEVVTNLASTYVSQYFPTLTGQVARTFDDTRRANFVDKSSAVPKTLQKTAQKILGKIPIAENQKIPYIDAWGRTEENDNFLLRAFENFVSPGYVSKIEDDKVNKELAKVYTNTGESGVIPKKAGTSFSVNGKMVYLDAAKYVQYATDKGQYSRKYLEEIMSSGLYNGLSSDGKAEAIAFLFSYANAKAKSNVSDYDYREISTYKTAAKLEDAGISPASYAVAKFATSKENADTDGSGSVSKSEKQKALRNAGFSSREANKILNINKK